MVLAANLDENKETKKLKLKKCLRTLGIYKELRKIIEENYANDESDNTQSSESAKTCVIDSKCRVTFLK